MIVVSCEHGLERGDDLVCARLWPPILFPKIPGPQIHQRLRKQRGRIIILGESLRHRSHGLCVSFVESLAFGPLSAHISCDQCLDVGLFPWSGAIRQSPSLLDHLDGAMFVFLLHRTIDIGAECQSNSPIGHGRLRIEMRRSLKRPNGFFMIERINESEPLIEIPLGLLRCGSDGMMERT